MTQSFQHESVMLSEIVDVLGQVPTGVYVDATLGGAGHATALLEQRDDMSLIGIDRDPVARAAASKRLNVLVIGPRLLLDVLMTLPTWSQGANPMAQLLACFSTLV